MQYYFNLYDGDRYRFDDASATWQRLERLQSGAQAWLRVNVDGASAANLDPDPPTVSAYYTHFKPDELHLSGFLGFRHRVNDGAVEMYASHDPMNPQVKWAWHNVTSLNPHLLARDAMFVRMEECDAPGQPATPSCEHDFMTSFTTGKPWCRKCGQHGT